MSDGFTQVNQGLSKASSPAFLFVVDTCLSEEELQGLKDSLRQVSISRLLAVSSRGNLTSIQQDLHMAIQ